MPDDHTYGASRSDMGELLNMIGGGDVEFPQRPARGGGGGSKKVRFTLTSGFTGTTASATFTDMAGNALGSGTLKDPESIATGTLLTGWKGYATSQGGEYFFDNAKCDQVV